MSKIKTLKSSDTVALWKNIERETEKAILLVCMHGRRVWFPKSQIEIGEAYIFLPVWLAVAKGRENGADLGTTNEDVARQAEAERRALAA